MNHRLKNLILEHKKRRHEIKSRLREFRSSHHGKDEALFKELCFCILTANANALSCNEAMRELEDTGLLFKGSREELIPCLKGRVRFHNKKADFILNARKVFRRGKAVDMKSRLNSRDVFKMRDWLVENIKGFGYKEASHFLRNIGLGQDIAILDRHILKNLKDLKVINDIPRHLSSKKTYVEIEDKMRRFSKKVAIPIAELDLLFWSLETGFVFK